MKLVLLPGLDGTGILFKPFIDALPDDIDSLVISYPTSKKLNYSALVKYVIGQLPKDEFILVGESFSGPIAYQIALTKPKHLLSVIFVATFLSSPRPFLLNFSRLLPVRSMLSLPLPDFMIKPLLRGSETNMEVIDLLKQARKQVLPGVIAFRLQEIANLKEPITACSVKSTYLQAENDKLVPASCLNDFKKLFSNLSVFQVKGSHMLLQSNPASCADIVMNEIRLIKNRSTQPAQ